MEFCLLTANVRQVIGTESLTQEFELLGIKCKSDMTSCFCGLVLGEAILSTMRDQWLYLANTVDLHLQKHSPKQHNFSGSSVLEHKLKVCQH